MFGLFKSSRPEFRLSYEPVEDITVWELARALDTIVVARNVDSDELRDFFNKLPAEVQRHFVVNKPRVLNVAADD